MDLHDFYGDGGNEGHTPELKRHIFRYLYGVQLDKSLAICHGCVRDTSCQPRNPSEFRKSRYATKKQDYLHKLHYPSPFSRGTLWLWLRRYVVVAPNDRLE